MDTPSQIWKPGDPVQFTSLGVTLRSLAPADIDDSFVEQLRDPVVLTHLAVGRDPDAITRANVLKSVARFDNRSKFFLGIYPEGGAERLGFCFAIVDAGGVAVLSLAITRRDRWRQGAATAATRAARQFLFDSVRIHKMAGRVYEGNVDVIRRLEQYGWVREGRLREAVPDGKGGRRDILLYGLLREDHMRGAKPKAYSAAQG